VWSSGRVGRGRAKERGVERGDGRLGGSEMGEGGTREEGEVLLSGL